MARTEPQYPKGKGRGYLPIGLDRMLCVRRATRVDALVRPNSSSARP